MSHRVIGSVVLALLAVASGAGADDASCRKSLGKAIAKYSKARFKAIAKCEDKRSKGTLPPATVCRPQCNGGANAGAPCNSGADCDSSICATISDVTTQTKIATAATTTGLTISTGCPGPLPEIGPACDSAANVGDLTTCITSARQDEDTEQINVDSLVVTAYDTAAPVTDTGLLKCEATISKEGGKYLDARFKADEKCNDKLNKGKIVGPCPDALTTSKVEKARVKLDAKIRTKCSEAQLAADTAPQLTFGVPCEKYKLVTFKRPANAIPVQDRFIRCLTDATAGVADRMVDIAYPQRTGTAFRYGVAAGDMTDTSVVFWTQVPDSTQGALLEVATDTGFMTIVHSSTIPATPGAGGTVKKDVTGLTASTMYFYRFTQGADRSDVGVVKTVPSPASAAMIRIGWSGDSNAFFRPYSVLDPIRQLDPDAWFFIGDTIYGDDARSDGVVSSTFADYAGKYRDNRLDGSLRNLMQAVGTYSMSDDHEVTNDYSGAVPAFASKMVAGNYAFRRFNPVREDGGDPMQLYRSFKMGSLAEFFVIDNREYRSAKYTCCNDSSESAFITTVDDTSCHVSGEALLPFGLAPSCASPANSCQVNLCDPSRTFLGAAQKAWLKNGLLTSTATFKFVMNGTPITQLVFQPYDRWEAWPAERDEILGFIETNAIPNVIWLSTDLHGLVYSSGLNVGGALPAHPNHIEVVAGAIGMDTIFRELPPSVAGLLSAVPSLLTQVQEFDIDRFNAVLLTVSPGLPATAKIDVYDRSNTIIHSFTFNAN